MDIFAFIEKLQKKPEPTRRKILLIAVISTMIIIISVWLIAARLDFQNKEIKNTVEPFDFIKEDIRDFYGIFKNFIK
ncbi:MAG: hypothetical protein COY22_01225 [Candidatus Tagabacteria bacterium CG_4_10_14_0_2_um_filter_40_13]|uniref:Uncharacterized protein n=1 Tax=Candidatus Tagabacteria bacterium CG03_land_8_20_14_0_80_41_22 TaxID=1975020 RepID=A0A2M7B964_9BACT|nr:MAG: hypothetical protein COV90_00085 [Candidatus Tagabacteria bacterium CG11_big_fil_rev_8_21_14_0_20_41_11]PIU99664.1 MAG: hypothetical protein COS58_01005 [Candidatus Tagabacteria bacterium CG03_land_8_20_14_0_80_41_22]PIZ56417.1 MAG: hypothetical protein COY22_01225 [Candidatus Tagabacteria bacterium CG_4_10_14_0_2_um_filter_40_13]